MATPCWLSVSFHRESTDQRKYRVSSSEEHAVYERYTATSQVVEPALCCPVDGKHVLDRCNWTILVDTGFNDLPKFEILGRASN
jgi:hypothetical protein